MKKLRQPKNLKKDRRSSRKKWADTTKPVSLQLHQVYDLMKGSAALWSDRKDKYYLGTPKHFIIVPPSVMSALLRYEIIRHDATIHVGGHYMAYYSLNDAPETGLILANSRENEKQRKNNVGVFGKTLGTTID